MAKRLRGGNKAMKAKNEPSRMPSSKYFRKDHARGKSLLRRALMVHALLVVLGLWYMTSSLNRSSSANLINDYEGRTATKKEKRGWRSSRRRRQPPPVEVMEPTPTSHLNSNNHDNSSRLIHRRDYIYRRGWDEAPVVIPEYKLIFFTIPKVGCTVFKQLFRRMMGFENWRNHTLELPHSPYKNGLKYLSDFSITEASSMLYSDEWTKAIFVRNPKERVLSAFLDKAKDERGKYLWVHCCKQDASKTCAKNAQTFEGFLKLTETCHDPHWNPQSSRMESKYLQLINFVGHMDDGRVSNDTRVLLERIGAWEDYGETGWGKSGNESIFGSVSTVMHVTRAREHYQEYYTPDLERQVQTLYQVDYDNPVLHFDESQTPVTENDVVQELEEVLQVDYGNSVLPVGGELSTENADDPESQK